MTTQLAQEIVEVARDLEYQDTVTSLVFATLTYFPRRFPAKWCIRFPGKIPPENHESLTSALRALVCNGFMVNVDKLNEWLRHTETKPTDSRSRMVFAKSTLGKQST